MEGTEVLSTVDIPNVPVPGVITSPLLSPSKNKKSTAPLEAQPWTADENTTVCMNSSCKQGFTLLRR